MSFMAGFGQAFSESFENSRRRREKQEDDIFKMSFQKFLDNDEQRKKDEIADAGNVRKAQALSDAVPGVNKKAATAQIYKMLTAGLDEDFILEELRKPGASVEFTRVDSQEKKNLEEQTDAMLAPGSESQKQANLQGVQENQEGQKSRFTDTFAGGLFGSPYSKRDRSAERAAQKIAEGTGQSVESVQQTMRGSPYKSGQLIDTESVLFTPGKTPEKDEFATLNSASIELAQAEEDMKTNPSPSAQKRLQDAKIRIEALKNAKIFEAQAEAAAEGGIFGGQQAKVISPDGTVKLTYVTKSPGSDQFIDASTGEPIQGRALPVSEEERKDYIKLSNNVAKTSGEYTNKVTAMTSMMRAAGSMGELVDQTGGAALSERAGGIAQYLQGWGADATTVYQMYENLKNSGNTVGSDPDMTFKVQEMEKTIDQNISQGVSDIGTARALFEAKVKILAYKLASMQGQDGRALAEKERELFEKLAAGGNSPQKFHQNMANLIFSEIDNLRSEGNILNKNNVEIEAFQGAYNWPKPPFPVALSVDEIISEDPVLKAIHDKYSQYNTLAVRSSGSAPTQGNQKMGQPTPNSPGQMGQSAPVEIYSMEDAKGLKSGTRVIWMGEGKNKGQVKVIP